MEATVALGPSTLRVPSLGVGAWSWGDARYWGYGARHTSRDVLDAFMASVEGGARLFDTAEVYGHGASEQVLGWLARRSGAPVVLATKYAPLRGRGGAGALLPALRGSLRRMGVARVDLYQVHWADTEEASIDELMAALADAVAEGLVTAVGVSNFSAEEMRRAHAALARRGVALASNQVRYNALHRAPETDGVLDACRELGASLLAYSPLEQGVLLGSYAPGRVPSGPRGEAPWFAAEHLAAAQPIAALLRSLGAAEGDRPPEQVALNWLRAKPGVIPLAGARNGEQAARNVGALGWTLSDEAVARIDEATARWR
ncbi:MAG: aldo/keto reductase [Deltaproteobacteria bacterium]|nr:aldo/keto reductase [Myxococcales bacterium]MDP3221374.1 aldo/keto reductase [Deltaproteobacteria bacterium]